MKDKKHVHESELSYDGRGINGPDEHRTRLATFSSQEAAKKYGKLFEVAPDLLALAKQVGENIPYFEYRDSNDEFDVSIKKLRELIAKLEDS